MSMAQNSGIQFIEVTVTTATTSTSQSYQTIESLIDTANHPRWFAFVDDHDYWVSGGDKVVAITYGSTDSQKTVYRNDASYGYMRNLGYGSSTGKIASGTKFKVIYLP